MFYLTRMLGRPVTDSAGQPIGTIKDLAIATGEVFPRVTSLALVGPDKTPFMLSWRKFVDAYDEAGAHLNTKALDLRFSYQQPDEVLLARDLLNKQIVDTQGMKVVRVNDLKLSESRNQLRLLGAEVGTRGILRGIWPPLEGAANAIGSVFGRPLKENLIAWNYMELLDRDLGNVKLSVSHRRLHELHPADIADVLEQLSPSQRALVFQHLDDDQVADTISEMEDEIQAQVVDDLTDERASDILEIMDPDDAADIIGDLPYDKAEALLRLMGVREARQVRKLLGYREKTAGGIMTPEITTVSEDMTAQELLNLSGGIHDANPYDRIRKEMLSRCIGAVTVARRAAKMSNTGESFDAAMAPILAALNAPLWDGLPAAMKDYGVDLAAPDYSGLIGDLTKRCKGLDERKISNVNGFAGSLMFWKGVEGYKSWAQEYTEN